VQTLGAHSDTTRMDICAFLDLVIAADDNTEIAAQVAPLGVDETGERALVSFLNPAQAFGKPEAARRKAVERRFVAFLRVSGFSNGQIGTLIA
jgi:hypothetical protein